MVIFVVIFLVSFLEYFNYLGWYWMVGVAIDLSAVEIQIIILLFSISFSSNISVQSSWYRGRFGPLWQNIDARG